jgi:catechol 2,3-dioxygenase-like lactoylglutathione lyase family enzyme
MLDVRSATFGIRTRDLARARAWYAKLLGREPDFLPAADVYEWRLAPGAWLQLVAGEPCEPGRGQVARLGVAEIDAARAALQAAGASVGDVWRIPDVVALCDFEDPFGNPLSIYEDLTE